MYKIICSYCGEEITFENLSERTESCTNCLSPMEELEVQKVSESKNTQADTKGANEADKKPLGLTLIYQITNEKLDIVHTEKVVLGRKNFGAEVLGKIPQISRRQCLIEFIDNQYRITDLDSMHGTYIGTSKIDCKENPQQLIKDAELIYLGREPFLAKLHLKAETTEVYTDISAPEEIFDDKLDTEKEMEIIYRCLVCGEDLKEKKDICSGCGSFGQWEEIQI